ncbi:MAG: hypothetical protein QY331_03870 [Melioribacteraceae bacterium]|nr:hypothetical protein [Melioribacteraceae bacterium]RJP62427.1 MAG: hypothetical protein C4543_02035 [Ignavibacteriales bacterium]WKZ70394.1 MAG: hypothetical protein QY331_03870 [Melioribacteraceae bacterium]
MKYLIIILLFTLTISAQSKPGKKDSLLTSSKKIEQTNEQLRNDIDALKKLRDSLQQKLRVELKELYILRYGEEAGSKVSLGQIWTGMTEEMMKDSWGEPDSVTVNNQPWGKFSQWYYGDITYFFKNGELFDWESPKTEEKK